MKKITCTLIYTNIDKPTSFHINNLGQNNIRFTKIQINLLYINRYLFMIIIFIIRLKNKVICKLSVLNNK